MSKRENKIRGLLRLISGYDRISYEDLLEKRADRNGIRELIKWLAERDLIKIQKTTYGKVISAVPDALDLMQRRLVIENNKKNQTSQKSNRIKSNPRKKINTPNKSKTLKVSYNTVKHKIQSGRPLKPNDIAVIRNFIRTKSGNTEQIRHLFHSLIQLHKNKSNKRILRNLELQEVSNRSRLERTLIADAREKTQRSKKIEHLQERLFANIRRNPEQFYSETPEECRQRVENIENAIGNLDERIQNYAEFNLKFFSTLASEERIFEPIKLPDDAEFFRWPDTDVIHSYRSADQIDIDAQDSGVLSLLGYNVQVNGPTDIGRRRVLNNLFTGNICLPPQLPDNYLAQWGNPNSAARLRKLAYSIASFTRQQKRKRNASIQAIRKWEEDLAYLRNRYYEPFSKSFFWPKT